MLDDAALVRAIDDANFYRQLARFTAGIADLCAFSAYRLAGDASPTLRLQEMPEAAQHNRQVPLDAYSQWAYALDPLYRGFRRGIESGIYALRDLIDCSLESTDFYDAFYSRVDARDELSMLVRLPSGGAIVLYLMRSTDAPRFADTDAHRIRQRTAFITECVQQHETRRRAPADAFAAQLQRARATFGCSVLSPRERELTSLLVGGVTMLSAALHMGISPATVRNHRKSVYRKLGVGSHPGLIALFVATAGYADGRQDPIALRPGSEPIAWSGPPRPQNH